MVTIGLGGLRDLSKGLPTRRERDLERAVLDTSQSRLPQTPSQETTVIRGVRGARRPGSSRARRALSDLRRCVPPDRGGLGDGLRTEEAKSIRSTIAGGFVLVSVAALMAAWRACRLRTAGDRRLPRLARLPRDAGPPLRRRTRTGPPTYTLAELARLLGVTQKRARASVKRLVAAGLLEWSDSAIGFPDPPADLDLGLEDTIGRGRGSLAIPRRMLRFLVDGARPALIATALGVLLRCLSRRKGGFDGRGRVKASWIARVFGVDLRRVKAARRELVDLGWIEPEPSDQWAENRWGGRYRIDLAWDRAPGRGSRDCHPSPRRIGPRLPPPLLTRNLYPRGRAKPGTRRGADWVFDRSLGEGDERRQAGLAGQPDSRPDVVRLEDLKDTGPAARPARPGRGPGARRRERGGPAQVRGGGRACPGDRQGEPVRLVRLPGPRGGCWRYITQADEDRANARIKAFLRGPALPASVTKAAVRAPSRRMLCWC